MPMGRLAAGPSARGILAIPAEGLVKNALAGTRPSQGPLIAARRSYATESAFRIRRSSARSLPITSRLTMSNRSIVGSMSGFCDR